MANNNVQNVKFLRNGSVFTPSTDPIKTARQVALDVMELQKASLADGTAILGRYQETNGIVKTLVGFAYVNGETRTLTVFDVEGASADVEELRQEINAKLGTGVTSANTATAQLAALSGTSYDASGVTSVWGAKKYADDLISTLDVGDTAVTGSYVSEVSQADGKISVSRVALPVASSVSGDSKVLIDVTQDKGKITASAANITGVKLAGYVEGTDADIAATDTLGEALGKLQAQINAMDKSADVVAGQVVTTVTEEDGKVTETKANVKDLQLGGYAKTSDTGAIASSDTINAALSKLENTIGSNAITNADGSITVTPANGSTTDVKVHIKSGENVIKLDGEGGGIYTNLNLVEITDEATLPAEIKVRYELRDSDGVKIGESIDIPKDSHIVSIAYNESTQKLVYTYIDVKGITQTTEIDLSHLVLEAEFASGVTFSNGVAHGVVDPTSENFLTVGANGFKLAGVQDAINTAISGLDATVGSTTIATDKHVAVEVVEVDGKLTALNINESNIADADDLAAEITNRTNADTELSNRLGDGVTTSNTASAQLAALSGSSATAQSGDTSVEGAKKYADAILASLDATVSGETTDGKVNVKVTETNGVITAVNVVGTDIASARDLSTLSGKTVTGVTVNDKAVTVSNNVAPISISATHESETESNAINVNTANDGSITISLLGLDCGTY